MSKKVKFRKLPVIGLVMIVKDESHVITEALQSIADFIDYYVISDTGSTDNTESVITDFFKSKNVDGQIFHDTWSDFGTNRSLVLQHAMGRMQYAIMVDADDVVKMPSEIKSKKDFYQVLDPTFDGFKVGIVDEQDSVFYWRTQIFNLKVKWKYDGVLHEYPVLANARVNANHNNLKELPVKIVSRRLGSRNRMDIKDKYRKDAEMLLRGLEKEPLNTRYMFYLAQSFRDCHEFERSIEWYQKRVDFGGWYEEVFYSLYMIGKMALFSVKNEPLGIRNNLKAFSVHPKRVESMNSLVQYYKMKSEFRTALMYVRKVKDVPFPAEDGLFLENELYSHTLKLDYMLLSFLCFEPFEFYDLKKFVEKEDDLKVLEDIRLLQTYPSLLLGRSKLIDFPKDLVPKNPSPIEKKNENYRVFNPSVARKTQDGTIWINIRCSNFDVHYLPTDKDGMIRTENFIAPLDLSRIYKMVDKSTFYEKYRRETQARILGYEDIRLFWYNGRWCFMANNDEIPGHINSPQMVFGRMAENPNDEDMTWDIEYVIHLKFPYQQKTEKNWVPLLYDDDDTKLDILYSCHPVMVLCPDLATGFCFVKHELPWSPLIPFPQEYKIRNSTPFIQFRGGWLGVSHVVYFLKEYNYQRVYYNIFVWLTHDFTNVRISNFFHFEKHIVEFANGIARTPDNKILLSYSLSDSIPKTAKFEEQEIEDLLL
jgi:hypothetical protein